MFIICPKCAAKYQIPEGINLQEGQKIKCSACDFVFLKGEESPLILEQPVIQKMPESPTEAFSTPLYSSDDSEIAVRSEQNTSLPEAFQPVSSPAKSRTFLWFIPIYIILIIALCMMGWHFRDSLKPSIQEIVPKAKIEKEVSNKQNIGQTKSPIKEKEPVKPKKTIETTINQEIKKEIKTPLTQTVPEIQPTQAKTEKASIKTTKEAEIPVNEVANKNINTELILPPEEELVPLFEAITEPVPTVTKEELEIAQISFKMALNEQETEQLLVEGLLQNKSDKLRSVPTLTVVLFDKDNNILNRKKIHLDNELIEPRQALPFYTGITPVPVGINHIDVQF